MTDPFRGELEAAYRRIEQMEADHAAVVAKLRAESDRLRARLEQSAPPSQTKTGKTFFALAMIALSLSLGVGIIVARIHGPPHGDHDRAPTATVEEPNPADVALDAALANKALEGVSLDGCGTSLSGRVSATFEADGSVSNAVAEGPLHGTRAGACVEARIRALHVAGYRGTRTRLTVVRTLSAAPATPP